MELFLSVVIGGVNFRSAVIASLLSAYIIWFLGIWLEGIFGLPRLDFAQFGKLYIGDRQGWWSVGMATHFLTKTVWGIFYAWLASPPNLLSHTAQWLSGLLFGIVLGIVLVVVGLIGKSLGGKAFEYMPAKANEQVFYVILYAIFGFFVGVFYTVPSQ
ncbi:MAG: hypothetical protein V2G37_07300 [bacterium JZ-2024 1]